ncbi:MAG: L-aspartate oxidase [Acidimicrobiales bacterium]|nr:MAG: L-aspartate oxidase [Acidimicrobiales bacterium]
MLPRQLLAPAPGWSRQTDVCVIGSGIAGLCTALRAAEAGFKVIVVTKENINDGSTRWAQGGIAAVLDLDDSPQAHAADTLAAGGELCDAAAVDVLVREGPLRLRELMARGASFDRYPDGRLMLTREGGHRAHRIVHAGGDATGAEVQRALLVAVAHEPGIEVIEHALVLDALHGASGGIVGVTLHVLGEGSSDGVGAVLARATVLATGGMGQTFGVTTNPVVSTGDGVALALRAGAAITDLEFVQFHPTALYLGPGSTGQQPLVSEAMRGEGAHLVDAAGQRFMLGVHELAELAPRDVVAKTSVAVMLEQGTDHVYLDARHLGAAVLRKRFPTIVASCTAAGLDPAQQPIPVAPAAHYASGGVRTDLRGRSSVPGLYACGEVACTGVHGANRLASNSLLEGLVFAERIAADLARDLPAQADPAFGDHLDARVVSSTTRDEVGAAMSAGAGVLRSTRTLRQVGQRLRELGERRCADPRPASWEASNVHTVASLVVSAAALRSETRGCHWRDDFPHSSPEWRGHLVSRLVARDGNGNGDVVHTEFREVLA